MFLAVTCQHASGACQSHSCPVLNLREASRKNVELSPSTPPFLTLRSYEKDLTPTPNLLRISGRYSLRSGISFQDVIFSLSISLFFCSARRLFQRAGGLFPSPLNLCHYYSNKNPVHRPRHCCLPLFVITAGGDSPLPPSDRPHCCRRRWTAVGPATWITPTGLTNGVRGIRTPQS
jgi:hypothetical protein